MTPLNGNGPLFNTHVVVDWSARAKPSPRKCSKDAIWLAAARDGEVDKPEYVRTRHEAVKRLAGLIADDLGRGRNVLVGFDFPFSYPTGVAQRLADRPCALAMWRWLHMHIEDHPDNRNNRLEVAAMINGHYAGLGPHWERPPSWPKERFPEIPAKESARSIWSEQPRDRRIVDCRAKGAKTVWQLTYPGSVGSQVLVGLPALMHLVGCLRRRKRRILVWPFDTGLTVPYCDKPRAVFAEVYPSLLRKEIEERKAPDEILDRAQVRALAKAFAKLAAKANWPPCSAENSTSSPEIAKSSRPKRDGSLVSAMKICFAASCNGRNRR